MVEAGLRERSKARRRTAITRSAFQLFAERGYDATTVADIAEAAEVAPRTVAMYFRSKQDIALCRFTECVDRLTAMLREREPGESALDVLGRWLRAENAIPDDGTQEPEHRMFEANPELRALRASRMTATVDEATRALAEELGLAPDAIGPRLATAAAAAIVVELGNGPQNFGEDEAIDTALAFLRAGLATLR